MSGYVIRRLTPHADQIIARYTAGETFDDIAADHGCAWGTIRRFLISCEVELRCPQRTRA